MTWELFRSRDKKGAASAAPSCRGRCPSALLIGIAFVLIGQFVRAATALRILLLARLPILLTIDILVALLVLLALILGIYLQKHGYVIIAFFFVAATALAGLEIGSRTAGLGILLALAIGSTYHLLGRYRRKVAIALLLLSFLTPLWVPSIGIKPSDVSAELDVKYGYANSIVYRLHIWDFVTGKIYEKPLLGWGAGASKRLGTEDQGILNDPNFGPLGEAIPVHPHNGILQIWLEFGALALW